MYSLIGFEKGWEQGKDATIRQCADVVSKLENICKICPFKCYRGTEKTCVDKWALYLAERMEDNDFEM